MLSFSAGLSACTVDPNDPDPLVVVMSASCSAEVCMIAPCACAVPALHLFRSLLSSSSVCPFFFATKSIYDIPSIIVPASAVH